MQNGEIECKTVKLKKKMIDSPTKIELDKQYGGQKNKMKIEALYLNFNTKTSKQRKIETSAKITKLVIAKCVR